MYKRDSESPCALISMTSTTVEPVTMSSTAGSLAHAFGKSGFLGRGGGSGKPESNSVPPNYPNIPQVFPGYTHVGSTFSFF